MPAASRTPRCGRVVDQYGHGLALDLVDDLAPALDDEQRLRPVAQLGGDTPAHAAMTHHDDVISGR